MSDYVVCHKCGSDRYVLIRYFRETKKPEWKKCFSYKYEPKNRYECAECGEPIGNSIERREK
jgi:DNA-directed RNA polymerase subunit RPC12/RpoP